MNPWFTFIAAWNGMLAGPALQHVVRMPIACTPFGKVPVRRNCEIVCVVSRRRSRPGIVLDCADSGTAVSTRSRDGTSGLERMEGPGLGTLAGDQREGGGSLARPGVFTSRRRGPPR